MGSIRARSYASLGRVAARLPHFRGKNRAFLLLFDALRLGSEHTLVQAVLRSPVTYRAQLDLHSWLQRIAFLSGEYEAETVLFLVALHRALGGAGYILDIGANIGLISIPTALLLERDRAGDMPHVVSVEAVPDNAAALRDNIALNGAGKLVKVIERALGDRPGTVDIQVEGDLECGEGTGTANILPAGSVLDPNGTYECVRIPIQVDTLDALQRQGQLASGCSVVKIDTDGYDLKVLEGGTEFIARQRPVIFGEFSAHCMHWHGQSLHDVSELAESAGYVVWQRTFDRGEPRFHPRLDAGTFKQDLLLVPSERARALAWCLATAPSC